MEPTTQRGSNPEPIDEKTYQQLWHLSAQFVHDIRNPLLTNLAISSVIQQHWKAMSEGYEAAVEHGLVERDASLGDLGRLGEGVDGLVQETEVSRELIERYWREVNDRLPMPEEPWKGNGGKFIREIREELSR